MFKKSVKIQFGALNDNDIMLKLAITNVPGSKSLNFLLML